MKIATNIPLLIAAIVNGLILAAVLARGARCRGARKNPAMLWLALLVAVLAIRIVPYPLGFWGAYDRWRWLTFLPIDATLALGPLLYTYVTVLAVGAPPARLKLHFAPAALQLLYQLVAFTIPVPAKGQYYQSVHVPVIEPIGLALVLVSLLAYTVAAWRVFTGWQRWMDGNLSNRDAYRCGLVRVVMLSLSAVTLAGLVATVRHVTVAPLNYAGRAPTMLAIGALVYGLGIAGVAQSGRAFPVIPADENSLNDDESVVMQTAQTSALPERSPVAAGEPVAQRRGRPSLDYAELGRSWTERVRNEGWYRDPQLTLGSLANHLNVSPRSASRVLRDGLGITFHSFVNRLRVEEVANRLADPAERRTTLVLAMDAGFASKASFTRAFREVTGTTASSIRKHQSDS